uniref:Uncharacterized protein n=1 Tax=Oxyrrhis marina TaxID=2969 RepID=A0A7S3XJV1_OXYMA
MSHARVSAQLSLTEAVDGVLQESGGSASADAVFQALRERFPGVPAGKYSASKLQRILDECSPGRFTTVRAPPGLGEGEVLTFLGADHPRMPVDEAALSKPPSRLRLWKCGEVPLQKAETLSECSTRPNSRDL